MKKEYISVNQLANIVGKTSSSIYKRLKEVDNQLSTYATKVDNRTMIDISAVKDVYGIEVDNQVDNLESTSCQPESTQNQLENDYIEHLKGTIEDLREQNQSLTQLLNQQQQLTLDLQNKIKQLEAPEESADLEEPKGFFSRLFKK